MTTNPLEVSDIFFDQGGTLLLSPFAATLDAIRPEITRIVSEFGIDITADAVVRAWKAADTAINFPTASHFSSCEEIVAGALNSSLVPSRYSRNGAQYLSLNLPTSVVHSLAPAFLSAYRAGLSEVIAGDERTSHVAETVQELASRGYPLSVFSNDTQRGLYCALDALGITEAFKHIYTSEWLGVEKPSPQVFVEMVKIAGLEHDPSRMVYVGDDPIRDIAPATQVGLQTVFYNDERAMAGRAYEANTNLVKQQIRDLQDAGKWSPSATVTDFRELLDYFPAKK